jgi:hypothetical protein
MMPDHLHAIVRIEPVPIEGMHDPVPDVGAQGRARLHQHRNSNGCKFCYKNWVTTLTPNVFRILLQF